MPLNIGFNELMNAKIGECSNENTDICQSVRKSNSKTGKESLERSIKGFSEILGCDKGYQEMITILWI